MQILNEYETPIKHGKAILRIHPDIEPMNPRTEWDNAFTIACKHRRYNLGDEQIGDIDEFIEYLESDEVLMYKPVYMYEHSGITINTKGFSCGWDSGQIGFIYITKEDAETERLSLDKLEKLLDGEIQTYDDYLTGTVYGFTYHEEIRINPNGDTREINEDSCWGFYGYDYMPCILEHLPITTELKDWI